MTPELEQRLASDIASFCCDPLGFVLYAFPWGEAGTQLANESGPRRWQADGLREGGEAGSSRRRTQFALYSIRPSHGQRIPKSKLSGLFGSISGNFS